MAVVVGHEWVTGSYRQPHGTSAWLPTSKLAATVLIGAIVSVLIALVQAVRVWEGADWILRMDGFRRPGANFGQPNHLATLLLMGVASLVLLFETRRLSRILAVIAMILLALGLAMSESRTGLLGALVLTVWGAYRRQIFSRAETASLMKIGWFSLVFFVWFWPIFITFWYASDSGAKINMSPGLRLVVWPQLIEAILQRPWLGWGLREVSEAHNAVAHAYTESGPFTYAHNVVLDMAIGMGIPLTVLLLTLSANWFWRRIHAVRDLHAWYCMAALLPVIVHSMLEFPYAYLYFLVPVLLAAGMLEAHVAPHFPRRLKIHLAAFWVLLWLLVTVWSAVEYVLIEQDFQVARFEALRVGRVPSGHLHPEVKLLTQLDEMLVATRAVPSPGMISSDMELLRRASMRFPWTAIQNRYALSLALNGELQEAVRQLRVMRTLHGEKAYMEIKANWETLAEDKYPQLRELKLP